MMEHVFNVSKHQEPQTPFPCPTLEPGTLNLGFHSISQTAQVVSWYILWASKYLLSYYIDGV